MIGKTIVIDRLLAEALAEYIATSGDIQRALNAVDIVELQNSQERMHFSARKVAHLVACALLKIDQ
jgi:hypothetical protein